MKNKFLHKAVKPLAFLICVCMLAPFCISVLSYENNDAWVLEYENMREKTSPGYTVPTLFKNDRSFTNHHRFPLVVNNNIHYVPLEMFSGLSGIRITSGFSSNFYITNNNDGRYISFDTEKNLASTDRFESYALETKIFHSTRYIPAQHVADALGIKMEVFADAENGIYALRLSDSKAKLSLAEVIKMYTPIKKDPAGEQNNAPENVTTHPNPEIGSRNIYLSFNVNSYYNINEILRTLSKNNVSAVFFVKPGDILNHSDSIRQIIAYGQNIGFLLDGENAKEQLFEAKENLRLVSKRTSRLVRFDTGSVGVNMTKDEYKTFVEENGLCVWDWNIHAGDYENSYDTIYDALYKLGITTAVVRVLPGKNTSATINSLCSLVASKKQLRFYDCNEITAPLSYR